MRVLNCSGFSVRVWGFQGFSEVQVGLGSGSGRVGSGQVKSSQARSSQVKSSHVKPGQARPGQVRSVLFCCVQVLGQSEAVSKFSGKRICAPTSVSNKCPQCWTQGPVHYSVSTVQQWGIYDDD